MRFWRPELGVVPGLPSIESQPHLNPSASTRQAAVAGCRFVDEVLPATPYVMTEAYIEELVRDHGVDYFVHGDDPCVVDGHDVYEAAKKAGRFCTIPRTEGISTTDIVGRLLLLTKDHHDISIVAGSGAAEDGMRAEVFRWYVPGCASGVLGLRSRAMLECGVRMDPTTAALTARDAFDHRRAGSAMRLRPGMTLRGLQRHEAGMRGWTRPGQPKGSCPRQWGSLGRCSRSRLSGELACRRCSGWFHATDSRRAPQRARSHALCAMSACCTGVASVPLPASARQSSLWRLNPRCGRWMVFGDGVARRWSVATRGISQVAVSHATSGQGRHPNTPTLGRIRLAHGISTSFRRGRPWVCREVHAPCLRAKSVPCEGIASLLSPASAEA